MISCKVDIKVIKSKVVEKQEYIQRINNKVTQRALQNNSRIYLYVQEMFCKCRKNYSPQFNERVHNSKEYLNKINKYYQRNMNRQVNQNFPLDDYLIKVLNISLSNHAARWWEFVKEDIIHWTSLRELSQKNIRQRTYKKESSKELSENHLRRMENFLRQISEYFIERIISLKSMTVEIIEEEIIDILKKHFNQRLSEDPKHIHQSTV